MTRIAEIDGLRAIAMTMVIAHHCGLMPFGWAGVWLFFVISGYVISRNFILRSGSDQSAFHQYTDFISRRFYRIVPVYALYVLIASLIALLVGSSDLLHDLPFLATFTFNWQRVFEFWPRSQDWQVVAPLWSLSVEEQFYVVFPFLFLLLSRSRFLIAVLLLIAAGPLLRLAYSTLLAGTSTDSSWLAFAVFSASFAHFDAFLLGALVAYFEGDLRQNKWLPRACALAAGVVAVAYVCSYVWVNKSLGATGFGALRNIYSGTLYGQYREVFVYCSIDLLAVVAVLYAALRAKVMRPLAHPILAKVGEISYGGYLFHALVLWLLGQAIAPIETLGLGSRLFWFAVAWVVTIAIAWISYHRFEAPLIRWSKKGLASEPVIVAAVPAR